MARSRGIEEEWRPKERVGADLDGVRDPFEGDVARDERCEHEQGDAQQREPRRVRRVLLLHEQREERENCTRAKLKRGDEERQVAKFVHELLLDDRVQAPRSDEQGRRQPDECARAGHI